MVRKNKLPFLIRLVPLATSERNRGGSLALS